MRRTHYVGMIDFKIQHLWLAQSLAPFPSLKFRGLGWKVQTCNRGLVFLVTRLRLEAIQEPPRSYFLGINNVPITQETPRDLGALCPELGAETKYVFPHYVTQLYKLLKYFEYHHCFRTCIHLNCRQHCLVFYCSLSVHVCQQPEWRRIYASCFVGLLLVWLLLVCWLAWGKFTFPICLAHPWYSVWN